MRGNVFSLLTLPIITLYLFHFFESRDQFRTCAEREIWFGDSGSAEEEDKFTTALHHFLFNEHSSMYL